MTNYPNSIVSFRAKENKSGVVFDETKKTVIFVEDLNACENEVKAIEETLGTNFKKSHILKMLGESERLRPTAEGYSYDHIDKLSLSGEDVFVNPPVSNSQGFWFNSDMSRVFCTSYYNDTVYEGVLSTPGDITTLTFTENSYLYRSTLTYGTSVWFSPDGLKMFILKSSTKTVYAFNLSVAFDLTTVTYSGNSLVLSSTDGAVRGLCFNPAGTKLYYIGAASAMIKVYELSTAFDITTAVESAETGDYGYKLSNPYGFAMSQDGKTIIVFGSSSYKYEYYTLSNAFDVSSGELTGSSDNFNPTTGSIYAMYIKADYKKVILSSSQYNKFFEADVGDIAPEYVFSLPETFTGKYITGAGISFSSPGTYELEETEFDLQKRSISGTTAGEWSSILSTKITVGAKEYDSRDSSIPCVIDNTKNIINSKEQYRIAVTKAKSTDIYGVTFWIEVNSVQ